MSRASFQRSVVDQTHRGGLRLGVASDTLLCGANVLQQRRREPQEDNYVENESVAEEQTGSSVFDTLVDDKQRERFYPELGHRGALDVSLHDFSV